MGVVKINERLTVAGQPQIADFPSLSAQGYKSIINARPDGEEPEQPGNVNEKSAAGAAGIAYSFIPVSGATMTEADIRAFQRTMAEAEGPVFAHCKGGTRALTLYVLGEALDGRMEQGEIETFGKSYGFDLSGATRWLERRALAVPHVKAFFDPRTSSLQYVVSDPSSKRCAIIDPVYDFDEKSGATGTMNADAILDYVTEQGLSVDWVLDTHPHADHFSAAHYLAQKTGAKTAIGAKVTGVQKLWQAKYNWPDFDTNGSQWDQLFEAGDRFHIGSLEARVLFSPGHTLASISYVVGNAAFVHDTLFMPDSGTARADFPGGSARELWASIQDILALPDETRLFTGHDYQPGGRAPKWESTVDEQKRSNPHLADMTEEGFIQLREARDSTLPIPKLILHALQVNIRGGRLPEPEANGKRYLKFPLDVLEGSTW